MVNLDRCVRSCNTLKSLSNRVCLSNETYDLNLHVFNMITEINESRALTNIYHANVNVSLIIKNVAQIKSGIAISIGASVKI